MKCPHCGKEIARPLSIVDLKDIIAAAEREAERLQNNYARMSPHGLIWNTREHYQQWKDMKAKIRDTNRQIANIQL